MKSVVYVLLSLSVFGSLSRALFLYSFSKSQYVCSAYRDKKHAENVSFLFFKAPVLEWDHIWLANDHFPEFS